MEGEHEAIQRVETKDVDIVLGPYAAWIGPGIFAFAVIAYVLGAAFEAQIVLRELVPPALSTAAAAQLSVDGFVAHIHWRSAVLLLIAAGLVTVVVCTTMIAAHLRQARLQLVFMAAFVVLARIVHHGFGGGADVSTSLLDNLISLMSGDSKLRNALDLTYQIRQAGDSLTLFVGVAVASVLVLPRQIDSIELGRRVAQLRLLLFVAAALFVTAMLTNAAAYTWVAAAFSWNVGLDAGTASSIVVAGTYLAGASYTLILISLFLPCAAVFAFISRRLAHQVEGDADVWLEKIGLAYTWKGQFANVGALLAPLASSVLAQFLSSMN